MANAKENAYSDYMYELCSRGYGSDSISPSIYNKGFLEMSCPYNTRKELIGWLIKYKGYNRSQANKCSISQLYFFYYNSEKIFHSKKEL